MFSFAFILDIVGFWFNAFCKQYLHRWLETDLIYSAMIIHVGKESPGWFIPTSVAFGTGQLHQLDSNIKLRSSIRVKFTRPSTAQAVSRKMKLPLNVKKEAD